MTQDVTGIRARGRALEESFFEAENKRLLDKLREKAAREEKRDLLRDALKVDDEEVLDLLVEQDISAEDAIALGLVPLIMVAWADGEIQSGERKAILRAAEERGITPGSPSYELLSNWLEMQPGDDLLDAWKAYTRELLESLGATKARLIREYLMGNAHAIATAAGGFLGLKSISVKEQAVLDDLESSI